VSRTRIYLSTSGIEIYRVAGKSVTSALKIRIAAAAAAATTTAAAAAAAAAISEGKVIPVLNN
jgi:hypothetical protein